MSKKQKTNISKGLTFLGDEQNYYLEIPNPLFFGVQEINKTICVNLGTSSEKHNLIEFRDSFKKVKKVRSHTHVNLHKVTHGSRLDGRGCEKGAIKWRHTI